MMYAVIFRARIRELDDEYAATAQRMRDLAIAEYGCVEFFAVTEGAEEVAISYWETEEQMRAWKANAEHLVAQEGDAPAGMNPIRWKWCRSCGPTVPTSSHDSLGSPPMPVTAATS
ncbi:MAG: hypothetical protein R3E50_08660 [Halioglobus sp.]